MTRLADTRTRAADAITAALGTGHRHRPDQIVGPTGWVDSLGIGQTAGTRLEVDVTVVVVGGDSTLDGDSADQAADLVAWQLQSAGFTLRSITSGTVEQLGDNIPTRAYQLVASTITRPYSA